MLLKAPTDLTDCRALEAFYHQCRTAIGSCPDRILIDLSGVESSDTKLMACLVIIERDADQRGIKYSVLASGNVRAWAEVLGLSALL